MKGGNVSAFVIYRYLLDGYPLNELLNMNNLSEYRPEIFRRFKSESRKGYYLIDGQLIDADQQALTIYKLLEENKFI